MARSLEIISILGIVWIIKKNYISDNLYSEEKKSYIHIGRKIVFVLFSISLLANILGYIKLGIVLLNGLVFVLITFLFQDVLSSFIFADVSFHRFIPITGLWLMAQAIYAMDLSFIRSRSKIKLLSLINICLSTLHILILYLVLVVPDGNLETVLILYIITTVILSVIIYLFEIVRSLHVLLLISGFSFWV